MGKTSLAATFPNPIFIRVEDGLQSIQEGSRPDAFPKPKTIEDVREQIKTLIREEHDYKTLVIDSVTALDTMLITEIVASDPKSPSTINQALGGYGAGLSALAAKHHGIRKACGILSDKKNMNIVFISHADTETIDLPDTDSYTRYSLRLNKRSVSPYVDESDLVGFLKLETFTRENDNGQAKAMSDGTRVLVTYATAANISKNRYGITENITVTEGENPLTNYVKVLQS
jgi:hypothetical protein